MNIKEALKRLFSGGRPTDSGGRTVAPTLPLSTVEHDSVDTMRFKSHIAQMPRFSRICRDDAPTVTSDSAEPQPIDFAAATPEEVMEWQAQVKAARAAREEAKPYDLWEELCRDLWYLYHHPKPPEIQEDGFDPRVQLHQRIMTKISTLDDFADTRAITRDDGTMSAAAVMQGAQAHLRPLLETDLAEQVKQAQDAHERLQEAAQNATELGDLREVAAEYHGNGQPVPDDLKAKIRELVIAKRQAVDEAEAIMENPIPMTAEAQARIEKLASTVKQTATDFGNSPHFGQGFGEDEPVYENPEQALAIAEAWSKEPLRSIAQRYGKVDPDMRFKRAKRIVGGQEEIVDVEFSDNLRRMTVGELARLAVDDEDRWDEFLMKYTTGELVTFQTVGEEHAGRGPAIMVIDESQSTAGERLMFEKSTCLAVLNMMRREKRDCFMVAFSSVNQMKSWEFRARERLDAEQILDFASHFFNGGTMPLVGVAEAERLIKTVPAFRKADIILVTDGESTFGAEDKRARKRLIDSGIRLHGIGVGGRFGYLKEFVSDDELLVHVLDFELDDPNAATTALAMHIT